MKALRVLFFPVVAVLAAFLVGAILILVIGDNPIETYRLLLGSALWWPDGIGYTLFLATPLIFTGLAVAVAFRAGLLNIGAEGQLYVAAFAATWVGITAAALPPLLPPGTRFKFQGLRVTLKALFSVDEPIANSSQLVFPIMIAPCAASFCATVAS